MKKGRKLYGDEREGWMRFGVWVVVGLVCLYLIYMVIFQFLPRLRGIQRFYNEAGTALAPETSRSGHYHPAAPALVVMSRSPRVARG